MEIAPDIHRIPGVTGSNACLLAGEQMALIDTGIRENEDAIIDYIRSIGRSPEELRWVIPTHFHFDHSGSAAALHQSTGALVVAHRAETEEGPEGTRWLRQGLEERASSPLQTLYGLFFRRRANNQWPSPVPTEVHVAAEDGEVLPCLGGLRIIHTPGHTPGSICPYLTERKVLFVGDSILNNIDRLSRPLMWDRRRRRELDGSLRLLRDLEATVCCFGHGPPLTEDVMPKVRFLTDRPYDLPTWRIVLKNWRTLAAFRASTGRPGHWQGGPR